MNAAALVSPYTMKEVTDMLDCTAETVVDRIQRGELAAVKIGRSWIFPRQAFHDSLDLLAIEAAAQRRADHEAMVRGKPNALVPQGRKKSRARVPPVLPPLP